MEEILRSTSLLLKICLNLINQAEIHFCFADFKCFDPCILFLKFLVLGIDFFHFNGFF